MKKQLLFSVVSACCLATTSAADDLGDAYEKARELARDLRPTGSDRHEEERESRNRRAEERQEREDEDRRKAAAEVARQAKEEERRRIEEERQKELKRVQDNLNLINEKFSEARASRTANRSATSTGSRDRAAAARRLQELDALMSPKGTATNAHLSPEVKKVVLAGAKQVRASVKAGQKPNFQPLLEYYKYNRSIGYGLLPEEDRCALILSMSLGIEPGPGDVTIADLDLKSKAHNLKRNMVELYKTRQLNLTGPQNSPQVPEAEIAKRFFVRAVELKNRLTNDWGRPSEVRAEEAKARLQGKKGLIFLDHGGGPGTHIDLWNSDRMAGGAFLQVESANKVLFWELK